MSLDLKVSKVFLVRRVHRELWVLSVPQVLQDLMDCPVLRVLRVNVEKLEVVVNLV